MPRIYPTLSERAWQRVVVGAQDECWEWTGYRNGDGYGMLRHRGGNSLAHRLIFEAATGQTPPAVCHRCDNPPCCNPAHLFAGTVAINNRDMASKKRTRNPLALQNEAKTHCPAGHPYDEANTRWKKRSDRGARSRVCRACSQAAARQRYHADRAHA